MEGRIVKLCVLPATKKTKQKTKNQSASNNSLIDSAKCVTAVTLSIFTQHQLFAVLFLCHNSTPRAVHFILIPIRI